MNKYLANIISYLFHPLAMPTVGTLLILKLLPFYTASNTFNLVLLIVFIGTYLMPVLFSLIYFKISGHGNLKMDGIKERRYPFFAGFVWYLLTANLIRQATVPKEIYVFIFACGLALLITVTLLRRIKLSVHMIGIGGIAGTIMAIAMIYQINLIYIFMVILFLSGIIGTARLSLNAHTPKEVYFGFLIGWGICVAAMILINS